MGRNCATCLVLIKRMKVKVRLIILLVAGLSLVCVVCWPNFVRSGTNKTTGIINNLRQLDGAKQAWAFEHGHTGTVVVTREDITPYLKPASGPDVLVQPWAGEFYRLGNLAEFPEA